MEKTIHSEGYSIFTRKLREAREQAALTQMELAERLRCEQSFVSKCERGERRLDLIELRLYCAGLQIDFGQFVAELDSELNQHSSNGL